MTLGKRLKRVRGYAALARFNYYVSDEPVAEMPADSSVRTPYRFGPWQVERHLTLGLIVILETAHRCYDVYAVA